MPTFSRMLVGTIGRDYTVTTGCPFLRSVCCIRQDFAFLSGRKKMKEKLWREFFSNPSQWWDHRSEKANLRYPDFKHKKTQQALWIIDNLTPSWVESQLAAMAPGLVQTYSFSWNVRLRRHVKAGDDKMTLSLFQQMQREGMVPDKFTFLPVLNACSNLKSLEEGRRVHKQIIQRGCDSDVYVATCLVDMYAKCGSIEDAWNVFTKMRKRDVVSWNAMIGGYAKSEQGPRAIELFRKMRREGVEPDSVTFIGMLNACASISALEEGRHVHQQIIRAGCESDAYVATCLVDMYAKCGSIGDAWSVFKKMRHRNVVSWSAMIGGYAMHGHSKKAIALFRRLIKEGLELDGIIFICLLSACSHGGLVKEGLRYFKSMTSCFDVFPTMEHYACMVDLLGRAGRLEEAGEMTKRMPTERDGSVWRSLLGACRRHGNIEMAERAAKRCWEFDPGDASAHVLLSNVYAAAGKWDRTAAIERERMEKKVWKERGSTWIEVNNAVHSFVMNDKKHPQILEIDAELERLLVRMNVAGYVQDTSFLHEENKSDLSRHSEKLAIAYGLISTPPGTPLRIKKNRRVCPECHDAIKFIANMVQRVIIVKDADRFHRFKGGICSCEYCVQLHQAQATFCFVK